MNPSKETIIAMLDRWIRQRPGLDAANYFGGGDYRENLANYRSEVRRIGRQFQDARTLLRQVELSGITAEELAAAFPRAYSGRLTLTERYRVNGLPKTYPTLELAQARAAEFLPDIVAIEPVWALEYCAGQYWPTEYRAAACAVLASALWSYKRDRCMPEPAYVVGGKHAYAERAEAEERAADGMPYSYAVEERYGGKTAGDWLRSSFRRDFGRGIANRWFD